jgi:hypothetical protein
MLRGNDVVSVDANRVRKFQHPTTNFQRSSKFRARKILMQQAEGEISISGKANIRTVQYRVFRFGSEHWILNTGY